MKNILEFKGGYKAVISYDPEIELFRGEFVGLNGGADFYAADIDELQIEGEKSLTIYFDECKSREMLMQKLVEGEESAKNQGWISFEDAAKLVNKEQ